MKACVIIPAYNEAGRILSVIQNVKRHHPDILVIDDGSSDDTFRIAKDSSVQAMLNLNNQGKGASLIKGFKYALENNYDAVITMDADGQHLCEDIPVFLDAARDPAVDIVIGNRMSSVGRMPALRIATNRFMSWLISVICGQDVPDTQCGFRLIKSQVLKSVQLKTSRYETESEILIKAARLGFKIKSVPVKTIYSNQKSRINPFINTFRFLRLIFRV